MSRSKYQHPHLILDGKCNGCQPSLMSQAQVVNRTARTAIEGNAEMISEKDNEYLTRTGPGTPMGEMFRRYWIPALMASELPAPDCPPVRVSLLSERLIAFKDTNGKI